MTPTLKTLSEENESLEYCITLYSTSLYVLLNSMTPAECIHALQKSTFKAPPQVPRCLQ